MTFAGERLEDGRLRVPLVAVAADGLIGDGVEEIDERHPQWKVWDAYLRSQGR